MDRSINVDDDLLLLRVFYLIVNRDKKFGFEG